MRHSKYVDAIQKILQRDQIPFGPRAEAMRSELIEKHGDKIRAILFYGSGLREDDSKGKMLDFYLLVDSYKSIHGTGLKQFGSFIAPPSVHYAEVDGPGGERLRSKYSIVSLPAFIRRTSGGAFESMLWARFSQPTVLYCEDDVLRKKLEETLAYGCLHFMDEVAPLLRGKHESRSIWDRGLSESYRTELRPENSESRSREIVDRHLLRYQELAHAVYANPDDDGTLLFSDVGTLRRNLCRLRWFGRRVVGKPMGAFRVLKAFFTFDAGLNYVLEKVKSHSGVEIELSERAHKYPLLYAPVIAWKLFRRGAFR